MYEALYRYLIKYRKVDLPGIGVLVLQTQPAKAEIASHSFLPPAYSVALDKGDGMPSEKLFSWLAFNFNVTEHEAVIRFSDFIFNLSRQLKEGKEIQWHGVGTLQKEFSGEIKLTPDKKGFPWLKEVIAEKVTRQNAEHTMLVGEAEKTSTEMYKLLQHNEKNPLHYWWTWPLAIILLAIIFLGWHFSEKNPAGATGNNHKISPAEAPVGYYLNP
jgi:hypothetical protein